MSAVMLILLSSYHRPLLVLPEAPVKRLSFGVAPLTHGVLDIAQLKGAGYFQSHMGRGLILEYVAHGSLWDLVCRFGESGRLIPERLAWRIFLCCESTFPAVYGINWGGGGGI